MGFDNECILNIQSLAGEYFCPVCRTLVYPHEALQTQCTHLYCKPCLTYVVSSTQACPYDGYLVTEAGSKPLMETNKALAETIGKTAVHCLYHRSGCMWQGPLSECTTHCSGCTFGNSPVVCNRCGLQIVHRQVQEHAQSCNVNGTNTQSQGTENAQDAATSGASVSTDQSKIANQAAVPVSQPQVSHTATGPSAGQNVNQPATANPPPQALPSTSVPPPDQWYQQQYQQYYQQYPGYDPYQQQAYQQYYPYQQQATQQFQQPPLQVQGQAAQGQVQVQLQPQSQPQLQQQIQAPPPAQLQPQVQPQPQVQNHLLTQAQGQGQQQPPTHPQAQPQIPSNGQPQPYLYPQAAVAGSSQNQGQVNPQQQPHPGVQPHVQIQSQSQPLAHGHMPPQSYSHVQPHPVQNHAQQHMQVPQYQQPHPQMHHSQPPQLPPQGHPHFQPHPQPPAHSQPPNLHHTYPAQPHQQIQQAPLQQHPMQVQPSGSLPPGQVPAQFAPPPPHMRPVQPPHMLPSQGQAPGIPPTQQHIHPPHNQPALPVHQRPTVHQVQQPMPQQYVQQPQAFAGQASGQFQGQPHHAGPFAPQHSQVRPPGPPQPMQQPPFGFVQPQQGTALSHGMPPHSSQSYGGRPPVLNQGGQSQQFPQSSGASGVAPHARPPQFGLSQPSANQSNVNMTNQPHAYSEQQLHQYTQPVGGAVVDRKGDQTFERRVDQQEDKSPSLKKSESVANDFGGNINEVKPETGMNDERKTGNGGEDNRHDEALAKDAAAELHQVQGFSSDSVTTQRVKEERKDSALDHSPGGKSIHNKVEDVGVVTTDSEKQGEENVNFQGSSQVDNGSLAVPTGKSQGSLSGRDHMQQGHHDITFSQSQTTPQGQMGDVSTGFPNKGGEHSAPLTEQGRSQHPPLPYLPSGQQQRPAAPPSLQSAPYTGQAPGQPLAHLRPPGHGYPPHPGQGSNQPGPFHPEPPLGGPPAPGSASILGGAPNNFANHRSSFEPQSAGSQGQYNQGQFPQSSHGRPSRMSQGEPLGPPPGSALLPHGPEGQTVPHHPVPVDADMYQSQGPPHFDNRQQDSHFPGNLERGPYGQPFGVESNSTRMNGAPLPGVDSFRDEKFRTPAGMHTDTYPMGPPCHLDQGEFKGPLKQFPGPPHLGSEDSPKFGSHSSRPLGGYGMDGSSRFLDKDPHGYGYDAGQRSDPITGGPPSGFLPPYHSAGALHPSDSSGRPLPVRMPDDNRGRFDNNHQNPDFFGPRHGFSRHHMDRLPPGSPGHLSRPFGAPHGIDVDGMEMERHPFGERFPIGPSGHMHRGEFDGPGKPRSDDLGRGEPFGLRSLSGRPHVGEPGFGSFHDYARSGEPNGPGGFSHQQPFGESFGAKSTRPHLGEPGFRSSYSRQGFPNDSGFYAGGSDSYDQPRKRKTLSMGWCRICKVDCESVEGLDMHGQTREHQRMAMDMVNSIKQKAAKKQKTSNDHSVREEGSKLRNAEIHGRP